MRPACCDALKDNGAYVDFLGRFRRCNLIVGNTIKFDAKKKNNPIVEEGWASSDQVESWSAMYGSPMINKRSSLHR